MADKIAKEKPNQADRVYSIAARYSKKMADEYMNQDIHIGCMCPSIMVSGAGNFPVRKKEKQNQAWVKNYQFFNEIQSILKKMENVLYGKEQVKSSDGDAIEKLEEKLESLKDKQEHMKAANKAVRLKDTGEGNGRLRNMGYSDEQIKQLREPGFCGRVGYPDYVLQNNNANIHRIEGRIKSLQATKARGTLETENQFFKIVEDAEAMRLQLFFEGKPGPEVRGVLKSNGFRWAPSQSAWQRQLTNNARYSLERVVGQLGKLQEVKAQR